MEQLLQQTASGLANGAIYACLALALVMIFVSTGHINFAPGAPTTLGASMAWQLLKIGVAFWIALPLVAFGSFLVGVLIGPRRLPTLFMGAVLAVVVVFIGLLAIF